MWVCLRIPKTAEFLADSRFGWNFRGAKVTGYCAGIKGGLRAKRVVSGNGRQAPFWGAAKPLRGTSTAWTSGNGRRRPSGTRRGRFGERPLRGLLGTGDKRPSGTRQSRFGERPLRGLLGTGGKRPSRFGKLLAFPSRERSSRPRSGRRPRSPMWPTATPQQLDKVQRPTNSHELAPRRAKPVPSSRQRRRSRSEQRERTQQCSEAKCPARHRARLVV